MSSNIRDQVIRRIHEQARMANTDPEEAVGLAEFGNNPRWRMTTRDIEFECGCTARRFRSLVGVKDFDPIIFKGLPEQAVYHRPCSAHEAGMNKYIKFGGFVDFQQWKAARFRLITGELHD
jgi:hypothetical protein